MNDYFSALRDFTLLFPHLLHAQTEHHFLIWLDKLALIDSRALYLALKAHKEEIPEEWLKHDERRLKKEI